MPPTPPAGTPQTKSKRLAGYPLSAVGYLFSDRLLMLGTDKLTDRVFTVRVRNHCPRLSERVELKGRPVRIVTVGESDEAYEQV